MEDGTADEEIRRGGLTPTNVGKKMYRNIQVAQSSLVGKAKQLLDNETTNLAESWMSIRAKFDGGKFYNRSQSGSWQHHCMGAGLRLNIENWGPQAWQHMTHSSPNRVFSDFAEESTRILKKERQPLLPRTPGVGTSMPNLITQMQRSHGL